MWPNGDYYEGDFVDGMRHGEGTYVEKGRRYTGAWRLSQRHGRGVELWDNRDKVGAAPPACCSSHALKKYMSNHKIKM